MDTPHLEEDCGISSAPSTTSNPFLKDISSSSPRFGISDKSKSPISETSQGRDEKKHYQCLSPEFWTKYMRNEKKMELVIHNGSIPGKGSACVKIFVNERQYHSKWVTCDEGLPEDSEIRIPFLWTKNDDVHIVIYRTSAKSPELYGDTVGRVVAAARVNVEKLDSYNSTTLHLVHSETPYITASKPSFPVFTLTCTLSKPEGKDNSCKEHSSSDATKLAAGIYRGEGVNQIYEEDSWKL